MRYKVGFLAVASLTLVHCGLEYGGLFDDPVCPPEGTDSGVCADGGDDSALDSEATADAVIDTKPDAFVDADAQADVTMEADAAPDSDAGGDTGADSGVDTGVDAGPVCSSSGTVVFDSKMPCYKHGIFRGGNFLPSPDSSLDTPTCQTGTCANSPKSGDVEVLWVQETTNSGLFTSVTAPVSFAAHCSLYTAAIPPSLTQLKVELGLPTGWSVPGVSKVGTSYTLTAPACSGSAVLYEIVY